MSGKRGVRRKREWWLGFVALALGLLSTSAHAVVFVSGDGTGNATAPADDFGFAHVGAAGGLTAIYLGAGWVITADHVGLQDLTLAGVVYPARAGTKVVFEATPGIDSDIAIYKIDGDPGLPVLTLAATTPALDEAVTLVGRGWVREAGLTHWDADFVELPSATGAAFSGYKRGGGTPLVRWGTNRVSETTQLVALLPRETQAFACEFDQSGGTTDEAVVVPGDSGGAAFIKRGGQWELAGILFARSVHDGQPGRTAVFGNTSLITDVAFYRNDVLEVIAPDLPVGYLVMLVALASPLLLIVWFRPSRSRLA